MILVVDEYLNKFQCNNTNYFYLGVAKNYQLHKLSWVTVTQFWLELH